MAEQTGQGGGTGHQDAGTSGLCQCNAEETVPGQWLLVVPVMGLSARLGTVAIDYQAPPAALKE